MIRHCRELGDVLEGPRYIWRHDPDRWQVENGTRDLSRPHYSVASLALKFAESVVRWMTEMLVLHTVSKFRERGLERGVSHVMGPVAQPCQLARPSTDRNTCRPPHIFQVV